MNITFEKGEFVAFIESVQKWHRDRFDYVLLNMFQNFDRHDFTMTRVPESGVRDQINRYSTAFEKDHPFPNWRELI